MVRGDRGQPTIGAVILFPTDRRLWAGYGFTPARLQSVTTGSDGAFKFPLLPDGEYFVIAVALDQADEWVDPGFLAAAATQATKVSLKTGVPSTQNLQISQVVVK